jgi:hypothetical protein
MSSDHYAFRLSAAERILLHAFFLPRRQAFQAGRPGGTVIPAQAFAAALWVYYRALTFAMSLLIV